MSIRWKPLTEEIAIRLRGLPDHGDRSIRMTLDEIVARSGSPEPAYLRLRATWAAAQRGDGDWDVARRAGLVINFCPDKTGVPVHAITFRLDRFASGG